MNAAMGATDAAMNVTTMTGATDADGNECPKTGVCSLCLRAQCAGDSNMKWWRQGVLSLIPIHSR